MRIVHVLAERGWSGGETQLAHLVRHLHEQGHENSFVLAPDARFRSLADELDLPVAESNLRAWFDPRQAMRLRREVRRQSPDILHFGCGRSLQWGGLFAEGLGVPLRITTRRIDYPIGRSWYRRMRYRRFVDHVVANCRSVEARILDAGIDRKRVSLIHEGIDLAPWIGLRERRAAARRAFDIPQQAQVITCAATLRPRKGQKVLIDAFATIAADYPDAILFLAGEGSDASALRQKAEASGAGSQIRLPGQVAQMGELWAASDAMALVSWNEGLANACLEASAAALPCIVSDVGGLPEIVDDGVTGRVVAPGDIAQTVDALRWVLGQTTEAARAGEAGSQRTRNFFTAGRMAQRMEALFLKLLAERAAI
jgi:glycosyltransferase involved in cell wall biosynthesis